MHDGIVGIQLFRWRDRLFWCDLGFTIERPADDDVGYVGTHCSVLVGCLVNQVVGHLNVEVGAFPNLLDPGIISIDIWECDYLPTGEDFHLVAKLGLAARGHPYELGHHASTDDGRLLCLDQAHRLVGVFLEQMASEQALCQRPLLGEHTLLLQQGMHPGDGSRHVGVFDAVASLAVILHHLAGAAAALHINLIEDRVAGAGDADGVLLDEPHYGFHVKDFAQEVEEVAEGVGPNRFQDNIHRDGTDATLGFRLRLWVRNNPFLGRFATALVLGPGLTPFALRRRVFHVSTGRFVVAASILLADNLVVGIDVRREAVLTATSGAGQAGSLCSEFWLRAKFRLEASRSFYAIGPSMFLRFDKPGNSMVSEPIGLNNQRNSATETPAKRLPSFQLLFVAEIEDADVADLQTLTVTAE